VKGVLSPPSDRRRRSPLAERLARGRVVAAGVPVGPEPCEGHGIVGGERRVRRLAGGDLECPFERRGRRAVGEGAHADAPLPQPERRRELEDVLLRRGGHEPFRLEHLPAQVGGGCGGGVNATRSPSRAGANGSLARSRTRIAVAAPADGGAVVPAGDDGPKLRDDGPAGHARPDLALDPDAASSDAIRRRRGCGRRGELRVGSRYSSTRAGRHGPVGRGRAESREPRSSRSCACSGGVVASRDREAGETRRERQLAAAAASSRTWRAARRRGRARAPARGARPRARTSAKPAAARALAFAQPLASVGSTFEKTR
jgi:hypothetical protein